METQNLEDSIFQLQRLNLDPAIGQVVEEAANLLSDGRHLEAKALVEKAEAMKAAAAAGGALPVGTNRSSGNGSGPETKAAEQETATRVVGNLANGIAEVLAEAIQDLQYHLAEESRKLNDSFGQQLERLQTTTVEGMLQLKQRVEQLTETVLEQRSTSLATQERYEQLAAGVSSLQQADARLESEIGNLRNETGQVSERLEALTTRLGSHQEELSGMKSSLSEVSPRVATLVERLDRQAEAIRSIYETEARREAVLGQVGEVLDRLKASTVPKPEVHL